MAPCILFAYGTLRRDAARRIHPALSPHVRFLGEAKVQGQLFDLGTYPGMTPGATDAWVLGELYEIPSNCETVLSELDACEGCRPEDPQPHDYRRTLVTAIDPHDRAIGAWAYVLNRNPRGLTRIESGDYAAYCAKRLQERNGIR
jgi:gamma-glutamylcyclotransferase (GGCT)/AIG2-like uncharacterized protein YtfP